jgi:tetratricopeptide (TPR) repeat protein
MRVLIVIIIFINIYSASAFVIKEDSVASKERIAILLKLAEQNLEANTPIALHQAETAYSMALQAGESAQVEQAAFYLGTLYGSKLSDFKKGIFYYLKSIPETGNRSGAFFLAETYTGLGILYYNCGYYEKAIQNLSLALDVYKAKRELTNQYFIRAILANIYTEYIPKSFTETKDSFIELLEVADKMNNDSLYLVTAGYYTTALIKHKNYEEAEQYIHKALQRSKEEEDFVKSKQALYLNLGDLFFHEDMVKAAINQYEKARQIAIRFKMNIALFNSDLRLGNAYTSLDELGIAKKYITEAMLGFEKLGMNLKTQAAYHEMAMLALKEKNLESAYQYQLQQLKLKDSLLLQQSQALLDLQNQMMMDKNLMKKKEESVSWLATNLILIVLLGGCFFGLLYLNHRRLLAAKQRSILVSEKIILEKELQNQKLREEALSQQVELNSKTLTINALNMIQKNEILFQIKEKITSMKNASPEDVQSALNKNLMQLVNFGLNIDKDWDNFKMHFEQVHNDFFDQLKTKYPHLNSSDLKLCALLKLKLDTKEIASIMNISPQSVKVARSRLRKKLELDLTSNLSAFITQI